MNEELLKRLVAYLASVETDRHFIRSVVRALDTDDKKEKMIDYIKANEDLKKSDIYVKEMQLNKET